MSQEGSPAQQERITIKEAIERALHAFRTGEWKTAVYYFRALRDATPSDPEPRWWLARSLNMAGSTEEADREFAGALHRGLHPSRIAYYRAVRALMTNDYGEAERLAAEALQGAREYGDPRLVDDATLVAVKALGACGKWREAAQKYGREAAEYAADQAFAGLGPTFHPFFVDRMVDRQSAAMRREVDEKPINPNASLEVLLKRLPADWVHSIAESLGLPQERKVADVRAHIVSALTAPERLQQLVAELEDDERDALRLLLEKGGAMQRQAFARKFGDDKDDSYWVREREPESILGRLRDRGLVFVGRAPAVSARGVVLAIPAELRQLLAEALAQT